MEQADDMNGWKHHHGYQRKKKRQDKNKNKTNDGSMVAHGGSMLTVPSSFLFCSSNKAITMNNNYSKKTAVMGRMSKEKEEVGVL